VPRKVNKHDPTVQEFVFVTTESLELDEHAKVIVKIQVQRDNHRKKREKALLEVNVADKIKPRKAKKPGLGVVQRFRVGDSGLQLTPHQPRPRFMNKSLLCPYLCQEGLSSSPTRKKSQSTDENQNLAPAVQTPIILHCSIRVLLHQILDLSAGYLDPFDSLPVPQLRRVRYLTNQGE